MTFRLARPALPPIARVGVVVWFASLMFLGAARAQALNQFVGFGDSTADSGWYFTHPYNNNPAIQALYNSVRAAGGGIPTTVGGQMNTAIVSSLLGLTAFPVGEPGGTNYAAGGAVNIDYSNYSTLAPNTVSQIGTYLANNNGVANPNGLYFISSGGNDIRGAICPGGICAANATQLALTSAADLDSAIAQLHAAGARYFVVPILFGAGPGASTNTSVAAIERTYNQALYNGLASAGINFVPLSGKVIPPNSASSGRE